ncbi:tetratricopeptide repeat protein [Solimicrobium silvestre]|uniref:TPR repeat n=1 Tax=Solimicrobium silvestre TaxID=2099400 RepID=A0A2S9GUS4_9BURK|nr:tetratricopeptide repeat protein [Solimicrobium silvestre]PRC91485.1 TPR repeat [Solimicrobium silvestre]
MNKPGRNDPCFCGSKKKFKHCCMQPSLEKREISPSLNRLSDIAALPALLEVANKERLEGKLQEALAHYDAILRLNPNEPEALHFSGMISFQAEEYAKAEQLVRRSIASNPTNISNSYYLVNLSLILKAQSKFQEAVECQLKAIELQPDNAFAYLNLGVTLVAMGRDDEAIENYRKAIALNPDFKEAFYNLGIALRLQGDHIGAIQCNQRVLELDPTYVDAYINLSSSNIVLKNFDAVSAYSLKAIALNPAHFNSYYNLGIACHEQGNLTGSLVFFDHGASLNPNYMNLHCARSLVMLALGNFDQGWKGYEFRWYQENQPEPMRHYPYPWWLGESLQDKTIFVWGEQGIGDQMMFSSMLEELIPLVKHCIFACTKKVIPLFSRSFPKAQVIDLEDASQLASLHHTIDVQSALGSMARWLRPTLERFPHKPYFLKPDQDRVLYWKARLAELGPELKVGICWRSGNISGDRIFYCTQIEQWGPIFSVPGVTFVNLQYDECSLELAQAKEQFGIEVHAFSEVDLYDDIDETAALNKALDLVISAPTSASILSGALGVPTWQMVSGFNWQLMGTSENCWYSSLKTIHRNWDQPWELIMENIAVLLKQQVAQHNG